MSQEQNNKDIQKMLKYSKWDKNVVGELLDYSLWHRTRFVKDLHRYIQYFEIGFDTLVEAMDYINSETKDKRPEYRWIQWLMIKNNLKSFMSAFNLLSSGFYVDSMTILRSLWESIVRVFFITYYPESKDHTLIHRPANKGERKFNITDFTTNDLKVNWHYGLFSTKAHSNGYETIKDTIKIAQEWQKEKINIQMKRDMDDISLSINWLLFIMRNYLFFIKEFLINDHKDFYSKLDIVEKGFHWIFKNLNITHPTNQFHIKFDEAIRIYGDMKEIEAKR